MHKTFQTKNRLQRKGILQVMEEMNFLGREIPEERPGTRLWPAVRKSGYLEHFGTQRVPNH